MIFVYIFLVIVIVCWKWILRTIMCTINLFIYTQFGVSLYLYSVNTPVFSSFFERATFLLLAAPRCRKAYWRKWQRWHLTCGSWKISRLASNKNKRGNQRNHCFFLQKKPKKNKHGGNGGFDGFDSGLRKSTLISGGEDLILMGRWRDSLNWMISKLVERWYGPWMIAKNSVSCRILGGGFVYWSMFIPNMCFESTCSYLQSVEMWHTLGVVQLCRKIE